MCRLLGYATAGFNLSLNAVLGQDNVEDFRELSEIHNDGWGVAQLSDPAEAPHVRDGGAPTPETGTRIYKSTIAARHDSTFEALADEPGLINESPEDKGWLCRLTNFDSSELDDMMNEDAYQKYLRKLRR